MGRRLQYILERGRDAGAAERPGPNADALARDGEGNGEPLPAVTGDTVAGCVEKLDLDVYEVSGLRSPVFDPDLSRHGVEPLRFRPRRTGDRRP